MKLDQKQKALESIDQLINHTRELIEIISGDAKHIGDLGQIASLNRYVYEYLNKLRLELAQGSIQN